MDPLLAAKITYIFGIINIIGLLLVFFTCRCLMGKRITEFLWRRQWYQRVYQTHGIWWWVFFISVVLHIIFALIAYGNPF